jgi:thioredoxin-related protein
MPWLGLSNEELAYTLLTKFQIKGIPDFVLIDKQGELIKNAKNEI